LCRNASNSWNFEVQVNAIRQPLDTKDTCNKQQTEQIAQNENHEQVGISLPSEKKQVNVRILV
jgi:hypothetical protein